MDVDFKFDDLTKLVNHLPTEDNLENGAAADQAQA